MLNAADPLVAKMAKSCPGQVIFFSRDPAQLATQRARGQRVIYCEDGHIVAQTGKSRRRFAMTNIPLTQNGRIGFQIDNAMGAIGAAWALGIDWDTIRQGLASFTNDPHTTPGRFNVFDYHGATVIADYGHNPDAMLALVEAVEALPALQRHVVISGAGDRRDEDLRQQTHILGQAFDSVVIYQDQCQRGRVPGEVPALLRQGLANASRTREIHDINGEFPAIDFALSQLQAGDLCLILIDQVEAALAYIAQKVLQT